LRNRAFIPVGTIILIVVVILAMAGIYWYFTQAGKDCSDVRRWCDAYSIEGDCLHHSFAIRHGASDEYLKIQWWDTLAGDQYRVVAYIQSNDKITTFIWIYDLDELDDMVQSNWAFSETQRSDTSRMVECIKAGCPSCERLP